MASLNKKRGNKWEYETRDFLQKYYKDEIITTRAGSTAKDNNKEDLMFKNGKSLPFPPQCKSTQSFNWNWLKELPKNGILYWKRMVKREKKQVCTGKYVIMDLETFEKLMHGEINLIKEIC